MASQLWHSLTSLARSTHSYLGTARLPIGGIFRTLWLIPLLLLLALSSSQYLQLRGYRAEHSPQVGRGKQVWAGSRSALELKQR